MSTSRSGDPHGAAAYALVAPNASRAIVIVVAARPEDASAGSEVSHTVTMPSPISDGDLMLTLGGTDGGGETHGYTSWTQIDSEVGSVHTSSMWERTASSEPASYTFTVSSSEKLQAIIAIINGQDAASPINASASGIGTSDSPISPTVTTTVDDCLIIRGFACDDDLIATDDTGNPAGTTVILVRDTSGDGGDVSAGMAYESQLTAGATGTATWTSALSASSPWSACTIAIAPASGVDTRDKRFSFLGIFAGPGNIAQVWPNPDGTIGAADRAQWLHLYPGISISTAAGNAPLFYHHHARRWRKM